MAAKKPAAPAAKPAAKAAPKVAAPKAAGDLAADFEAAQKRVKTLKQKPDDDTLLRLYSLYKQGSEGDVHGDRPGFFDFVGGAKYDAWSKLKGTSKDDAMKKYIAVVDKLVK
jgi:acyl-CoA-binding protein